MTCPILKRPADCTRPGPSRLSFTPKPRPKQCVGELEIPGLPSTARTLFSGLRVSTHGKQAGPLVGFYHSAGRQPANSTPRPAGGYTHPAESFLNIEGQLLKDNNNLYLQNDNIALINNGIMYLFSDVRYHLASHEIEVLQNPGHATTMLGLLKYPDDFTKSQGLNQVWAPDKEVGTPTVGANEGFKLRQNYIINMPEGNDNKGKFNFKIPLKHFLGFCEDYKKILYGMQQRLTLTRTRDDNAILKGNAAAGGVAADGKIKIDKIS